MIGVLLILNSRGDIVLSRAFRSGFSIRQLADTFRLEVIATKKAERSPIVVVNRTAYLHMRYGNMFLVAACNENVDAGMVFHYMIRLLQIFKKYFGEIHENKLREHFATVQQLIDESMDYGYPQMTEVDLLKSFISTGSAKKDLPTQKHASEQITIKATGKIPWRGDGIAYPENEVFLDLVEDVNLLMSQSGDVLQREVIGRIVMKAFLSGMPECHLVINDKSMVEQARMATGESGPSATPLGRGSENVGGVSRSPVTLDDVTFHNCVQLGRYDADKSICFVPPDGEFVLMKYRSTENVNPPFRIVSSRVKEIGKTQMEVDFHLKAEYQVKNVATSVLVKVPCPHNTAGVKVRVNQGKAKYDPAQQAVVWKLPRVQGGTEIPFSCEITLIQSTLATQRAWARPPITMAFRLGMVSVSGLQVNSLRINEPKLGYTARQWVSYLSTAGQYQVRL